MNGFIIPRDYDVVFLKESEPMTCDTKDCNIKDYVMHINDAHEKVCCKCFNKEDKPEIEKDYGRHTSRYRCK